ncbi:MAG: Mannosyl-glycoprotein endo-beta-N-acetylglucosamidase [Firmicutes bacterium]|nr:Mannosyl-glycoprotein endo-beta-N-acetylglucosamidase [Bacillota bacterium]
MKTKSIINLTICLTLFNVSVGFCATLKEELFKLRNPQSDAQKANVQQTIVKQDGTIKLTSPTELLKDLTILGGPIATRKQCVEYINMKNPQPLITTSIDQLVDTFYEEGIKEGVRPDVAFAQSLHETGNFRYGGDVLPYQNNYAGIGATGNKAKGAIFSNHIVGVRSQIQHLLAYATTRLPVEPIVDPRYELLAKIPEKYGKINTWQGLSGNWAVPGVGYGETILRIHREILDMPI